MWLVKNSEFVFWSFVSTAKSEEGKLTGTLVHIVKRIQRFPKLELKVSKMDLYSEAYLLKKLYQAR